MTKIYDSRGAVQRASDGFNIAFALTDSDLRMVEGPSNYTLSAELVIYKNIKVGFEAEWFEVPLKFHKCSAAEIGLGSNSQRDLEDKRLFDIHGDYLNDARSLLGNWNCFDDDQQFEIFGAYDASWSRSVRLNLNLCNETQNACQTINY